MPRHKKRKLQINLFATNRKIGSINETVIRC